MHKMKDLARDLGHGRRVAASAALLCALAIPSVSTVIATDAALAQTTPSDAAAKANLEARLAAFKSDIANLGTSTTPGTYFKAADVPTQLASIRAKMVAYGNSERKTPGFRRLVGAKVGTNLDLSKPFVEGQTVVYPDMKVEQVYAQKDLVLDDTLSNTAQWFAEALAAGDKGGSDGHTYTGSQTYQGKTMAKLGERCAAFSAPCNAEIVAPGWDAGGQPYGWMATDTHYRWYFGVDKVYTKIGFGVAKDKTGKWYYVGLAGGDETPAATGSTASAPATAGGTPLTGDFKTDILAVNNKVRTTPLIWDDALVKMAEAQVERRALLADPQSLVYAGQQVSYMEAAPYPVPATAFQTTMEWNKGWMPAAINDTKWTRIGCATKTFDKDGKRRVLTYCEYGPK